MSLLKLERACLNYCGELRNKHKKQRRYIQHDGKVKQLWDLPKCAVACLGNTQIYKDHSKPVRSNTYDKVPILKTELLKYVPEGGKIGDQTTIEGCHNQVGRCAEPHAAKNCLTKEKHKDLGSLVFSTARDITTGEPMLACAICVSVFPTIK